MQTFARFPIGTDNTKLAGYVVARNPNVRLGSIALQFKNMGIGSSTSLIGHSEPGANTLSITIKEYVGSGWSQLVAPFNIAAGATKIVQTISFASKIGIFGSGNGVVAVEIPAAFAGNLDGNAPDIQATGRYGFGFDTDIDSTQLFPPPLS